MNLLPDMPMESFSHLGLSGFFSSWELESYIYTPQKTISNGWNLKIDGFQIRNLRISFWVYFRVVSFWGCRWF